jgi:hypothetical protein
VNNDTNPTCERCGSPLRRVAVQPSPQPDANSSVEPESGSTPPADESASPFDTCEVTATIRAGGRPFPLSPGERVLLGRNPASPISSLCTDNVSYDHAELYFEDQELFVVDTYSTNGTYIAGTRLQPGMPHRLHGVVTISLASTPRLDVEVETSDT